MEQTSNQLTLFLLPGMEADLDSVKETYYRDSTTADMLRDLILRSLAAAQSQRLSPQT